MFIVVMSSWGGDIDNGDEDDVIVVYFFSECKRLEKKGLRWKSRKQTNRTSVNECMYVGEQKLVNVLSSEIKGRTTRGLSQSGRSVRQSI